MFHRSDLGHYPASTRPSTSLQIQPQLKAVPIIISKSKMSTITKIVLAAVSNPFHLDQQSSSEIHHLARDIY